MPSPRANVASPPVPLGGFLSFLAHAVVLVICAGFFVVLWWLLTDRDE
jgi:hypothetical protein